MHSTPDSRSAALKTHRVHGKKLSLRFMWLVRKEVGVEIFLYFEGVWSNIIKIFLNLSNVQDFQNIPKPVIFIQFEELLGNGLFRNIQNLWNLPNYITFFEQYVKQAKVNIYLLTL